jgi:hypothetical protein
MRISCRKINAANTAAMTVAVDDNAAVSLIDVTGAAFAAGGLPANYYMLLEYDGSSFRLINGSITNTTVNSLTAVSGEGITVTGGGVVNFNYPGLSAADPLSLTDSKRHAIVIVLMTAAPIPTDLEWAAHTWQSARRQTRP